MKKIQELDEVNASDDEKASPLVQMIKESKYHHKINDNMYQIIICANNIIKHDLLDLTKYNRTINSEIVNGYLYDWDNKYPCTFTLIYRRDKDIFEIADGQHRYSALKKMPVEKQKSIFLSLFVYICCTDKEVRDYIRGCNHSHPFEISTIDEHRLPQIIDDLLNYYPNCMKVYRPFIKKDLFEKKLMKTDIYQNISFSSSDIVSKIVKINDILFEMTKNKQYCTDKKSSELSKKKAKEMKMMLG
jgi:hypothetical protein